MPVLRGYLSIKLMFTKEDKIKRRLLSLNFFFALQVLGDTRKLQPKGSPLQWKQRGDEARPELLKRYRREDGRCKKTAGSMTLPRDAGSSCCQEQDPCLQLLTTALG